jgi:hypothetical protein
MMHRNRLALKNALLATEEYVQLQIHYDIYLVVVEW